MEKVLVSGSAGFIGGYVVGELLDRGYEVVGLDNFSKYGKVAKSYDGHPRYRLVERGVAVAAASRYMAGGQQVGGPLVKGVLSRTAGRSLRLFARLGTRDATNSFKAYSTSFVREVGIDSRDGFEIGIELTAKAKRLRLPVAEIPTIWLNRPTGVSNFKVAEWIPKYMRWYRFAFGGRLSAGEIRARTQKKGE